MCIWELSLARQTDKLHSVIPTCLFPCVYLVITKATLVTLRLASTILLWISSKLLCTLSFHAAYRDCWSGESIYLQERAASFLVRLLIKGIDFIVRAKWHLSGNRHVESHLLHMYPCAVLLETLLYGSSLPLRAQAEKWPFQTVHFSHVFRLLNIRSACCDTYFWWFPSTLPSG